MKSLDDYKKKDDKDKKKPTTAYSGGEKSGMAVEYPDDPVLQGLVDKAKQGGSEHAS